MAFLKNKPLSCAKYFVEDVICADNNSKSEHERLDASRALNRRTSCTADCPPSPEKANQADEDEEREDEDGSERRRRKSAVYDRLYWNAHGCRATVLGGTATPEPPTTAAYTAHPKWRQHSPEKWVGGRPFTSTIISSNGHTASRRSITGAPYSRALLIDDLFAPSGSTNSPTTPEVRAFVRHQLALVVSLSICRLIQDLFSCRGLLATQEHSRRVKIAADATYKPVQRPDKTYFNSMWTEPADRKPHVSFNTTDSSSDTAAVHRSTTTFSPSQRSPQPRKNVGRELLQQIRQQHQPTPSTPKKQHTTISN